MPIFVTVMLALCNACWDLVLGRAAMLIKHVLCLVLPTDTTLRTFDWLWSPDAGEGHRVVRLRRLTVIIGHASSFGPFQGCRPPL